MKDRGWSISLDVVMKKATDQGHLDDLLEEILEFGSTLSFSRNRKRYGAILSLRRADLDAAAALARGIRIFQDAAERAGLPPGKVVWAEVMTFAEFDRQLKNPHWGPIERTPR